MEVLQIIQGREAVPVRAIPFLTGWRTMSPDAVAQALAGMDYAGDFAGLTAYKLCADGNIKKTFLQEWCIVADDLAGISATLKETQNSTETGKSLWRKQSISTLPAGVFVWCDELAQQYANSRYGMSSIDMETGGYSTKKPLVMEFDIEVWPNWASLVLEGFVPSKATPQVQQNTEDAPSPVLTPAQTAAAPAPVVVESASAAPTWTVHKPERYNGYTAPLHRLITVAHRDGKPRPTARDVVEAWRSEKPAEIAKMLPDGFDYYDAKGNTKPADLEAIRKAIGRMATAR